MADKVWSWVIWEKIQSAQSRNTLPASDKRALIICQLYSFVMGEPHALNKFVLQALDMFWLLVSISIDHRDMDGHPQQHTKYTW